MKLVNTNPPQHNEIAPREAATAGDLKRWNWGATWLPVWWGLSHNQLWVLLVFLFPPAYFVLMVYFGARGNEIAWKGGRFKSIGDFRSCQHKWALWGWGVITFKASWIIMLIATDGFA